jgi:hypothetical protein
VSVVIADTYTYHAGCATGSNDPGTIMDVCIGDNADPIGASICRSKNGRSRAGKIQRSYNPERRSRTSISE